MRHLTQRKNTRLPINQGGTGANTALTACLNLDGISLEELNKPYGLVALDHNGKIIGLNNKQITDTIEGPVSIQNNTPTEYTITNYNSFKTYNIVPVLGTFTIDGKVITFTPHTVGVGGFIINDRNFLVQITN